MAGRKITLKYAGTCRECGAELPVGSRARWYGRGRVYGLTCHGRRENKYQRLTRENPGLVIFSDGTEAYQNPRGRCEDAPCCGCCS